MLLRKILVTVIATTTAAVLATPAAAGATAGTAKTAGATAGTTSTAGATAAANPVIVVAGLSGVASAYEPLAARLRADGYRVFIYQLPGLGFGDIADSATAFKGYVEQVRASTGAARVDLVAHSEGGLVSRYYLRNLGGTGSVGRYVSLGTPQYGTYVANIVAFIGLGSCIGIIACQQMTIGSSFLAALNSGDDAPGDVRYTTIRTAQDELVRPTPNATLSGGATNILVQGYCPLRVVGHLGLVLDGTTYTIVRAALRDAAIRPDCFAL
ncbi:triacylglycerol lipase [Plantactinospora sp. KBS50]|uniref:esterase/lipase family protein n=1 Tax=Plantactinospora sp. KBS50 TaxID=2024580 RepID=UPI000BAB18F4|nr:alpha/beta fold hydrolase [Plantactinospora sp. KBS50]ASW53186.1 lipase [Plantactinospora sp. KBS50]